MISALTKLIAPLRQRIMNSIARAVVSGVDDSVKMQLLQIDLLTDETRNDVERFQDYGFTSSPKTGAESVVLFVGGNRDHGLAISVDDRRYRLRNLASGEVAIYDHQGSKIVLKANGDIELTPKTNVVINGTAIKVGGAVEAAIKGTSYIAAEATFLAALTAYTGAIAAIADPTATATSTLATAITAFTTAGTTAKSTKVTVG